VAYQRLLDLLDRKPGEELVPQPSVEDLVKVYPRLVTYEIQDQWLRIHRETLRWVHQEPQPCSSQEIGTHMEEIFGRQTYQALTYLKNTQRRLQDCASLIEVGRDLLGASTEYKGEDCPEDWKVAEVDLGLAGLQKETDRTIEEILAEPGAVPPQFLNPLIRLGSLFPLKRLSLFLPVAHREFLQARTGEDLEAWGIIQHEILHHTRDIGRLDFSERTRILFESMDHLDQVGGDVPEEVFANLQVRMLHQLLMASFIHPGQDYTPILDRLERAFQTTEALLPDQRKVIFPFAEKASRLQMDFIFDPRPVLAPWIQRARELARAAEE
jgi:hypothetical protein